MLEENNNRKGCEISNGTDLTKLEKNQLKKRKEAFSKETNRNLKKELKRSKETR